jgi:hypothetical protein
MANLRSCSSLKCNYVTTDDVVNCHKCGRRLRTARQMRRNGSLLLACGLIMIVMMGVITYNTMPILLHPGVWVDGSKFSGTESQAKQVLAIFVALILFGVVSLVAGIVQIITCRTNKLLVIVMYLLIIPVVIIGYQF